jgi:NAD(P)-dependent dehydrogenase (short-subunit alcohol dehydrogenase family)
VIGAGTRHGSAIAASLTDGAWSVAGLDPNGAATALPLTGDPVDAQAVASAVAETEQKLGPIGLLVLAADAGEPLAFDAITPQTWDATLDRHLRSTVNACHAVLPGMLERASGSIVAITPSSALDGTASAHHASAAYSVIGFVKALAREVGPRGVIVNAVAPGPDEGDPTATSSPLGRGLTPAELGTTVRYLAEERQYFAGQVLSPNGGSHL